MKSTALIGFINARTKISNGCLPFCAAGVCCLAAEVGGAATCGGVCCFLGAETGGGVTGGGVV